jgi:transcriptional regulator with XRE-family HTH domain
LQSGSGWRNVPAMKLDQYLTRNKMTATTMAHLLGCAVSTVTRIRKGEIKPDFATIQEILDMTGGQVKPNDFFVMPAKKARK